MEVKHFERHKVLSDYWWFRGRSVIVKSLLERYIKKNNIKWLDIGTGYGSMMDVISYFADEIDIIEPYEDARVYLERNFKKINRIFSYYFPDKIPDEKYSVVSMFDVLEHIESDIKALKITREKILEKGGHLILTVPAYQWLWSSHDVISGHYRRYNKRDIVRKLEKNRV